MAEIDINILLGMIGVGIAIGAAVLGFLIRSTRDTATIKSCIHRVEDKQEALEKKVDEHIMIAREADKELENVKLDVRELQARRDNS